MSRYNQEKVLSDLRVGIITFVGIFLLILGIVFAGGDKGLLFRKTTIVKAFLSDVGGLKTGSSVTMGGMTVGRVTGVNFKDSLSNQIEVNMQVRSDARQRIKKDSKPAVRTMGMLGDRYVDISTETENTEILPEGVALIGNPASDFDEALRQANDVMGETEQLLVAVNQQRGTAGRLVYDEQLYMTFTEIAAETKDLIKDFKKRPRRYIKFSLF